jgi:hypothetical protein
MQTYTRAARGFAARLPAAAVEALRADPDVRSVEPDRVVHLADGATNVVAGTPAAPLTGVPWNTDRLDQRDLPLSGSYAPGVNAEGVTAYMIGSGIRFSHAEFGGRAVSGHDVIDGGTADDCQGSGTHSAAIVGGATYGVAKGVTLSAVRVFDCAGSGTISGVIAGLDWVAANHRKPAVAHLGLWGGAQFATLDDAVRRAVAAGVTVVYGAGSATINWGPAQDACGTSPARVAEGIAVGASDANDGEWISSNFGPCVDLHAPGMYVESAWGLGDAQSSVVTSTMAAAAHAAGVAALYLAGHTTATPAQVGAALVAGASADKLTLREASVVGGTPNRLLYTGFLDGTTPKNAAPTAAFTSSCAGQTCTVVDASIDADGTVVAWRWTFGDGTSSSERNPPAHTYYAAQTYTVALTVTDDAGARSTRSIVVQIGEPAPKVLLEVRARKDKGRASADLRWTGTAAASVDVFRNGVKLLTTPNDGAHTDALGRVSGTYTYRVCSAGTTDCSAPASASF